MDGAFFFCFFSGGAERAAPAHGFCKREERPPGGGGYAEVGEGAPNANLARRSFVRRHARTVSAWLKTPAILRLSA
jgi:hypothetical protein